MSINEAELKCAVLRSSGVNAVIINKHDSSYLFGEAEIYVPQDEVIRAKTAILFEAAARIGAVISEKDIDIEQALASYGQHLGVAFQLVDDLLDYSSSSEALGKNVGDDLAEGKPTLPLIHAMQHANESDRELLGEAIRSGGLDKINEVIAIIESTGSLAYTSQRASAEADLAKEALSVLPDSAYKDAMMTLADFSVQRLY